MDVRSRLRAPLVRFRAALAKASDEFSAAAWDENFSREVEDLYRREVAPALAEVHATLEDLGARPTLMRLGSENAVAAAGASLMLTAASALGHADLPALLYGLPPSAAAAVAAREGLKRRGVHRDAEGRSSFYFLYQANQQLARGSF